VVNNNSFNLSKIGVILSKKMSCLPRRNFLLNVKNITIINLN